MSTYTLKYKDINKFVSEEFGLREYRVKRRINIVWLAVFVAIFLAVIFSPHLLMLLGSFAATFSFIYGLPN